MLGDFEECTEITSRIQRQPDLAGKYCLMKLEQNTVDRSPIPLISPNEIEIESPRWGTCFPTTCTQEDVREALNNFLTEFTNGTRIGKVESCSTGKKGRLDWMDYLMMWVYN